MQQNHSKMSTISHMHQVQVCVFHRVEQFVRTQHRKHREYPVIKFLFRRKGNQFDREGRFFFVLT